MSRLSDYADTLYDVLPCDSYEEIRQGMSAIWPRITLSTVNNVLHWVRTHPDEAGFNVGYVKRGSPGYADVGGRYYVINKDDATFRFSDDQRQHFDLGILMTIKSADTLIKNQVEMLVAAQVHEAGRVAREAYEDLQYELAGFTRRMRRAHRLIQEKLNGTR